MVSVSHRRHQNKRSPNDSSGRALLSCVRTVAALAGLLGCLIASLQYAGRRRQITPTTNPTGGDGRPFAAWTIQSAESGNGTPLYKQHVYFRYPSIVDTEKDRSNPNDLRGTQANRKHDEGAESSKEGEAKTTDDGNDSGDDKEEGWAKEKEGADDRGEFAKRHAADGNDSQTGRKTPGAVPIVVTESIATENQTILLAKPPNRHTEPIATVAYAVSVTGCGSDPVTEGGAVLKHSIHRVSSRAGKSKYDYQMFVIYHPSAEACAKPLEELGYRLLKRDVFLKVEEIQGDFLRERIRRNGCCGEKELIKLEAYTLTDYPIFVHLDLDVLVLKPMDDIFDMMLDPNAAPSSAIMWPDKPLPLTINAFFTSDYNMVSASNPNKPVQGGFLVARPDVKVHEAFREIVRIGDFREGRGWGGQVGPFHGSMTFQGLLPYYYNILHPGQAVELSRCIYNQMCDNPRDKPTVNNVPRGRCRTGEKECEDCRSRPLEDVVTAHFTLCQKPWMCLTHFSDRIQDRLCRELTHEWYRVRSELDQSWGRPGFGSSDWDRDQFFGYCTYSGKGGYQMIEKPYGPEKATAR